MKSFQLVVQFPEFFFGTLDAMCAFEDKLIACLPRTCDVDGHDAGSGTINFFIYTNAPEAAFRIFRKHLGTRKVEDKLRVAYRLVEKDQFITLWPRRDPRTFRYWYDSDENPFALGAKTTIPKRSKLGSDKKP